MDPRMYSQWPCQPRRMGGRAIPGLIVKAEQQSLPGIPKAPPVKGETSKFGQAPFHQTVPTPTTPTPTPSHLGEPKPAQPSPAGPGMSQVSSTVAGHQQAPLPGVAAHQAGLAAPKGSQMQLPGGPGMHGEPRATGRPAGHPKPIGDRWLKPPSAEQSWFREGGGTSPAGPAAGAAAPSGGGKTGQDQPSRTASASRTMGPNILGSFGQGIAIGQLATSPMGVSQQIGIATGAVAAKIHGIAQPQDSDRDRAHRDAYQQRMEQLHMMRREAETQSSMKSVPLVVSGIRRI